MDVTRSTGWTFTARTDKAMLNPALPTASCKTPQLSTQMPHLPFFQPSLLREGCSRALVSLETFLEAEQVPCPSSLATGPAWRVPEEGTVWKVLSNPVAHAKQAHVFPHWEGCRVTLARSRLFRCSWNADGLFSAATGKREEQSAQERKQAATRIFSNSILMSAIKIATQTSCSLYCAG